MLRFFKVFVADNVISRHCMLLLLDNYDSFTYNLKDYLERLGAACHVMRNDEATIEDLKKLEFSAIVISPGPQKPAGAGILNEVIREFHTTYPILGICLGHQALGEFFGATLVKAQTPVHGKVSEIFHNGEGVFKDIPSPFDACRYHSLVLEKWDTGLPIEPVAYTAAGEIMALKHNSLPLWGIQFHPEAILTTFGLQLLENWLNLLPKPEIWQL